MNRKLSFLICLLFLIPFFSFASEDAKKIFEQANNQYNQKNYAKATEMYESLLNKGYVCANLYFNLGNSYYRQNQIPYAILYYEKAKKISGNNEDINLNLKLANDKIVDKITPLPTFFPARWYQNTVNLYSIKLWIYISAFCMIISLIFAYLYIFKKRKKTLNKYFAVLFLIFFASTTLFAYQRHLKHIKVEYGIIFSENIDVKSEPNENSTILFTIHEGLKVKMLGKMKEWQKIKLADGKIGWIESEKIKEI